MGNQYFNKRHNKKLIRSDDDFFVPFYVDHDEAKEKRITKKLLKLEYLLSKRDRQDINRVNKYNRDTL